MLPPGGETGVKAPHRARLTGGTLCKEKEGVAEEGGGDETRVQRGRQGGDHLHNLAFITSHTSLGITKSLASAIDTVHWTSPTILLGDDVSS